MLNLKLVKYMIMKKAVIFFWLVIVCLSINSQDLQRKAFFGAYIKDSVNASGQSEVMILKIVEKSTAEKIKALPGDVILKLNDVKISKQADFNSSLNKLRQNDKIRVEVQRKGKVLLLTGTVLGKSQETAESGEVIYDSFDFEGGKIRVIVDKPALTGKLPAVLFIQGYTCSSMDNLGDHPYGQFVKKLAKQGFVVMRVEKPGEGDNLNTQECTEIDLNTEIKAFELGLQKLKQYDFVDTENVFIYGHSMGGIIGPVIASRNQVKGVIVYGTSIKTWSEYIPEMFRFQNPYFGVDYLENEKAVKGVQEIMYQFYKQKKSPEEIAQNKELEKIMTDFLQYDGNGHLFTRSYKYLQQIDDYNMTEIWSKIDSYVLSVFGEFDFEAFSDFEHKTIADVVNFYHPGKAEFMQMDGTTHAFSKVKSMKDGVENYNYKFMVENFNDDVVLKTAEWIKKVMNQN